MNKKYLILFFLLLVNTWLSLGQEIIVLKEKGDNLSVNNFAYRYRNPKATIRDINLLITAPEKDFIQNAIPQEVNYGFDQPAGWCKFTIKNISNNTNWILKLNPSKADSVQLFVVKRGDKIIKHPLTGHFQNIKDKAIYSNFYAFSFALHKNEVATCYLYSQRKYGRHAAIMDIQTEQSFKNYDGFFEVFNSIIFGILFLASIIGFVLCAFIYQRVFLYYSIYSFSFLILALSDTGFIHSYINNVNHQELINNYNIVFYYWLVGWHILFTVELLNVDKKKEKGAYWTGYASGSLFCVVAIVMTLKLPDIVIWYLSLWSYYVIIFLDLYIIYLISIKIAQKNVIAYFYLAGFLFTVIIGTIFTLSDLQILKGINQITDYFVITPVVEISCMVIGLGIHFSDTVKAKIISQEKLNATQSEIINIQEDERKRIAQDLHDDVGNSLAALKNLLIHNKGQFNIEKEIDNIIEDVRDISHNLTPVNFEEYALNEIVKQTVNKFQNHPSIQFDYDDAGEVIKLKSVTELVIYRIINELITNIIKHSHATQVLIQLIYQEESLVLMVEDNGVGIKNKETAQKGGLGLSNIKHRVEFINAKITIESDPKGTLIIIEIPYASNR
jgi:signal transduction histidine kinase